MLKLLGALALAALVSFALTPLVRRVARHFKVLDAPGGRKIHSSPTPLLGGLSIYAAFVSVTLLIFLTGSPVPVLGDVWTPLAPLLIGATLVMLLGIVDDVVGVRPSVKFFFQCLAGLILVGSGFAIRSLTDPGAIAEPVQLGFWGILLSFVWIVGITNALNLIDGLDGLASGVALIASLCFGILGYLTGQPLTMVLSFVLAGAVAGFIRYNLYPASVFLGDTGSMLLGYILASISILGSYKSATVVSIGVPILALGLPIMDTVVAMARRLLRSLHLLDVDPETGKWKVLFFGRTAVWEADQDHIHHRLLKIGLSQRRAVIVLFGASAVLAGGALLLSFMHSLNYGYFLAAVGLLVFLSIRRLEYEEFRVAPEDSLLWMFRHRFVGARIFQTFSDIVFILAAFGGSILLFSGGDLRAAEPAWSSSTWVVLLVQIVTFLANGFYKGAWRYTGLRDMMTLTRGVFLASLLSYVIVAAFWKKSHVGAAVFVNDFFILVFLVVVSRLSFRILNLLRKRRHLEGQRALIYGAGDGGSFALREMTNNPDWKLVPVGFLDDDAGKKGKLFNGLKILGGYEEMDAVLERNHIASIVLSTRKIPPRKIDRLKEKCSKAGVQIQRLFFNLEQL